MTHAPAPEDPIAIFRAVDTDGSGKIDVHELRHVLDNNNFSYDLHTVQALARLFSGGLGDASLSQQQFIALHRWLKNAYARYHAALQPGQSGLPRAVARDALGAQLADECAEAGLDRGRYAVENAAFNALLSSADADGGSSLDQGEFVRGAVALRGLVCIFKAFDTDGDGRVSMTFSQMVFLIAHLI